MSRFRRRLCLLILLSCGLAPIAFAKGADWDFLGKKDGIYVWKREQAGSEVPGFRGRAYIGAEPETILTEMLDWKHHTEWMFACAESVLLKKLSDTHAIMYNRIEAPWPIWDRDVIADTTIERSTDLITVRFKNIRSSLKKIPRRVVRLPLLNGYYTLRRVGPKKTKVIYQVVADIGGSIPRWLAIQSAAALPYETLNRLRKRVEGKN